MPQYELIDPNDTYRERMYESLDELIDLSGKIAFPLGSGDLYPSFHLLDDLECDHLRKDGSFTDKDFAQCEFVKVATEIPLSNFADLYEPEFSQEESLKLGRAIARHEFCKRTTDLLVLTNIARPGSVELRASLVLQDNMQDNSFSDIPPMDAFALQRAIATANKTGWPHLHTLSIRTTNDWACRNMPLVDGFAGSPTARAVSAFSRLLEKKTADEPMQLLWALVGIEALYVRGQTELFQQVREKSQALLGQQKSFKKNLSRMYGFRSRFLHGDLGFPDLFLFHDARPEVDRFDSELWDATNIAVAVLIATIQEIINRGWSGVTFTYIADGISKTTI
jgi:hypothetical protein